MPARRTWRLTMTTVTTNRTSAATYSGAIAAHGTTMSGDGTAASPVSVSVANGSTSQDRTIPRTRAGDEPEHQQERILERDPRRQLPGGQPERPQDRELA